MYDIKNNMRKKGEKLDKPIFISLKLENLIKYVRINIKKN